MTSLPRSTPSEQGVDPSAVLAVLDALEEHPGIEMHSLVVLRHGHVVAEGWWAPYRPEHRPLLYSLSKSFTATAAGLAQAEGLLDLDDPVLQHLPEYDDEVTDARTRSMTLRHLVTMSSGHDRDMLEESLARDPQDPLRGFLTIPPDQEPGTIFAYSQPCTYTLAAVIQRRAGMPLTHYLRPRLFDPLGIGEVGWRALAGVELGFTGLHARTEDVAKLGQLHLQRGRWDGRQVLPDEWVAEATRKHVDNAGLQPGKPDWEQGYGYCWWMARHGYRGDGAFGQFCVVLPEHDVVIATTAGTEEMQAILEAFWAHLLPGVGRVPEDAGRSEERLTTRLTTLRLETCQGDADPPDVGTWQRVHRELSGGGGPATSLTAVEVEHSSTGWAITLIEGDDRFTVPFAPSEWVVDDAADARGGHGFPAAASGGWRDGTLRVEIVLLESAHRLDVEVTQDGATATWRTQPLDNPPLRQLSCPG